MKSDPIFDSWRQFINEHKEDITKLRIFDFDDTLADTKEHAVVLNANNEVIHTLDTQKAIDEFESLPEEDRHGQYIAFDEFDTVTGAREIEEISSILRNVVKAEQRDPHRIIMILTARSQGAEGDIRAFLQDIGIDDEYIQVVGVGGEDLKVTSSAAKAQQIDNLLDLHPNVKEVLFFDDSEKNVAAVQALREKYRNRSDRPDVKFTIKKITHDDDKLRVRNVTMEEAKGDGQYQRAAMGVRNKFNREMVDTGGNRTRPPTWTQREPGTTVSAPPGAMEEGGKKDGMVIAIFGPSACGKTELKKHILNMHPEFEEIQSVSTRERREEAGASGGARDVEYQFVDRSEFLERLKNKELVNVNLYDENFYGTDVDELENTKKAVMLTDISSVESLYNTAQNLGINLVFVYCYPDSLTQLIDRQHGRKQIPGYNMDARLEMAIKELDDHERKVPRLEKVVPIYHREEIFKLLSSEGDASDH